MIIVSGLVVASGLTTARAATADTIPSTTISVNGDGGDKQFEGVGAILGGGGNARYLMDYPEPQRDQILDYLFKPGYGASLQILKLEIGGGTNSTDGAEPSVEPTQGNVNCNAGYELSIAQAAQKLNPNLVLYGLQWTAPAWVTGQSPTKHATLFTKLDRTYLIDWLKCAKNNFGLTINYIGGWNENAGGYTTANGDLNGNYPWYSDLQSDLQLAGFGSTKIIAGDLNPTWQFAAASPSTRTRALATCR